MKETIKELMEAMKIQGIDYLKWEQGEEKLILKKQQKSFRVLENSKMAEEKYSDADFYLKEDFSYAEAKQQVQNDEVQPGNASDLDEVIEGEVITSPVVGVFYASSSPDNDPFVKVGDKVEKGQVLCIIEAMKLMNDVQSSVDGVIEEVLVVDGQRIEFNQPLFKIST